jgi:hypothetical protein
MQFDDQYLRFFLYKNRRFDVRDVDGLRSLVLELEPNPLDNVDPMTCVNLLLNMVEIPLS